jgi:hypothetical protein
MRYLLIFILAYLAIRVFRNLASAVREDGTPVERGNEDRYADMDIEDANWEDIE